MPERPALDALRKDIAQKEEEVAYHQHTKRFAYLFKRLNPAQSFENQASSQYNTIKGLIEDARGGAAPLAPYCFLQGSYQRNTAIYSINDVDIVALCTNLSFPAPLGIGVSYWDRNQIFATIAAPLLADGRYQSKVRYSPTSMCIKVDLGIKVEILPVVLQGGVTDRSFEPFYLWRPESGQWEVGYARYHQQKLTEKNALTAGNFIPAIKVFKHLRSAAGLDAISFHIECFLYSLPDQWFAGSPAEYICRLITNIASSTSYVWYLMDIRTPCNDRALFSISEWNSSSWGSFHGMVSGLKPAASLAASEFDEGRSTMHWQHVLGANYFPMTVA